jgi:hypothetical protein
LAPCTLLLTILTALGVLAPGRAQAEPAPREPPPILTDVADPPIFGDHGGLIFLRDRRDLIRLYPHAELALDAHGFTGPGTSSVPAEVAGVDLGPRFFVRHSRFALSGEIFKRIAFTASMDLVANPALDGARADGTKSHVALVDAWGSIDAGRGLGLRLGVFRAPFTLENMTATSDLPLMERNMATRFLVPAASVLGASLNIITNQRTFRWDVGVFGAEVLSPGDFERTFDIIGRFTWRPIHRGVGKDFELGVSGRWGTRNPRDNWSDVGAIASAQGYALWRPTRTSSDGTNLHTVNAGTTWGTGINLRWPMSAFILRSELAYVSRATREGGYSDGAFVAQRAGKLYGFGWYAELSFWPLQHIGAIDGELPAFGNYPKSEHLEVATTAQIPDRYGLEIAAMIAGVNAWYDSASSSGEATADQGTRIRVTQFSVAFNYWQTRRFKLSLDFSTYHAPESGTTGNLALVPGNLPGGNGPDASAHVFCELAARTMIKF